MVESSPPTLSLVTGLGESSLYAVVGAVNIGTNLSDNIFITPYENFYARKKLLLRNIGGPELNATQPPLISLNGMGETRSLL